MPRPLPNQVVVVTGASSGIGREASLQFARAGARVVLAARNELGLETLADEIRAEGGQVLVVPTDVRRPDEVARLARLTVERFGRIDTWVNDAAISLYATFEQASLEEMRHQMDVNYWGVVHGLKAAIPRIKASGGGTVVTVGSLLSDLSLPLQSTYCASKHALRGLLEAVRMELAHDHVPISLPLIMPTSVDTPFYDHARTRMGVAPKPMGPVCDPAEVAAEIVKAAVTPRREVVVGGGGKLLQAAHHYAPGLYEWYQARAGFRDQQSTHAKAADAPSNFLTPLAETGEIRGTEEAREERDELDPWKAGWVMWMEEHPRAVASGLALAAGALSFVSRSRKH